MSPEQRAVFERGVWHGVRLVAGPIAVLSGVSAMACATMLPFPAGAAVGAAWALVSTAAGAVVIPRMGKP